MKKLLFMFVLVFSMIQAHSQSYLNKSLTYVKNDLEKKDIEYREYINDSGTLTIRYEDSENNEERAYIFDYSNKCYTYFISFWEASKMYSYGVAFHNLGFVRKSKVEEGFKWVMTKGSVKASCLYQEEEEMYFIAVENK